MEAKENQSLKDYYEATCKPSSEKIKSGIKSDVDAVIKQDSDEHSKRDAGQPSN